MHALSILSKVQINYDKYVSQKVTLHCPNLLTKAMDLPNQSNMAFLMKYFLTYFASQ